MFEMSRESKEEPKETEQEAIERIIYKEGFEVGQSFSRKRAVDGEVSTYLTNLQAKGKKPGKDYKLFIRKDGENLVFEK